MQHILAYQDRTIQLPRFIDQPPTGSPETVPADMPAEWHELIGVFELGRKIGADNDANTYFRGYSEGLEDGVQLGQLDDNERGHVIGQALGGIDTIDPATVGQVFRLGRASRIHRMPRSLRPRRPGGQR